MTSTMVSSSKPNLCRAAELGALGSMRAYRTRTSFVAVHFDRAGKGRIDFLPQGEELRVIGPSSCLREGLEVQFENRICHVFERDLITRSILILEPARFKGRATAVCA
jgi:hypothetical protein